MKTAQVLYKNGIFGQLKGDVISPNGALLIIGFGAKPVLLNNDIYLALRVEYPMADIILCSTAGEIYDTDVLDDSVSILIMEFEKTWLKAIMLNINEASDSFEAGKKMFAELSDKDLAYVLVLSDGGLVNGSRLVQGIQHSNDKGIPVTGGLAGDADLFDYTIVGLNSKPAKGNMVAVGFYGKSLKVGQGSFGGWDIFGPEKIVTRATSNKLFEIGGKNALDLYKQYLGKYADELPGSALLFPLNIRMPGSERSVVRTILSIDNEEKSMVFAGDIPEGAYVRFMKANFDKLIDAATQAANSSLNVFASQAPKVALLISCVGRKIILGNRIDEEIEAVKEVFGKSTIISGFYSYGEISPVDASTPCELHNQTMTITTFNED